MKYQRSLVQKLRVKISCIGSKVLVLKGVPLINSAGQSFANHVSELLIS